MSTFTCVCSSASGKHMTMTQAIFSTAVWKNLWEAMRAGHRNKSGGEGQLMGGLLVVGPGTQGILFEYREQVTLPFPFHYNTPCHHHNRLTE
jgi:hypothetical protein